VTSNAKHHDEAIEVYLQPLRDFVAQNHDQSMSRARLDIGSIDIYVRMTRRVLGTQWGRTLDLADITIPVNLRGRKLFSQILWEFERLAIQYDRSVYVESIASPIIRDALVRRGYTFRDGEIGSAWKTPQSLQADQTLQAVHCPTSIQN